MEIVEQKVAVFWFFNLKYRITKLKKPTVPCVVLWVCLNLCKFVFSFPCYYPSLL